MQGGIGSEGIGDQWALLKDRSSAMWREDVQAQRAARRPGCKLYKGRHPMLLTTVSPVSGV